MATLEAFSGKTVFEENIPKEGADFWLSLCNSGQIPRRKDFDPVLISRHILPHIVIIDIEEGSPRRFRWRLLGTHVTSALGRNSTGKYIDDVLPEEKYSEFTAPLDWVIDQRQPARIWGKTTHLNKNWLSFESFLAPMVDDNDNVNILFSVAYYGKGK